MGQKSIDSQVCSIARTLTILGERWTLLILREALAGKTRYADFERKLGLPPDTLADRLSTLVDYGIMTRGSYQEPGQRSRPSYHLTAIGRQLHIVLGALSDWGDKNLPCAEGPSMLRRSRRTGRAVRVGFIDELGYEIPPDDVAIYAADNPDHDIAVTRPATTEMRIEEAPTPRAPRKSRQTRRPAVHKSHTSAH
ncbi:MAG TPA: helix-turn-helix domain-containing protein [Mycobacterium sp.]